MDFKLRQPYVTFGGNQYGRGISDQLAKKFDSGSVFSPVFSPAKKPTLAQRMKASREYVDALNDLPPTWSDEERVKIVKFVPDFVSPEATRHKLDRVRTAERKLADIHERLNRSK